MDQPTPPEAWAFLAVCACCYLYPSWIAFRRNVPTKWDLLFVNVVLGWTVIGYFGCMLCAMGTKPVARGEVPPKP